MSRRKLRWVAVGLALVALAGTAALTLVWPKTLQFTRKDYDRIDEGMTPADVEAILGPPNFDANEFDKLNTVGSVELREVGQIGHRFTEFPDTDRTERLAWAGPDGAIVVYFDDGRATGKHWALRDTLYQRLWRWWYRWL
jgi:hypothetical protein